MCEPDQDRDPLEVLADEFIGRQRRGESPSISEYVTQYPELAEEIRELKSLVLADTEYGDNVGVVQPRGGLRLSLKALQLLAVQQRLLGQHLHGTIS